jgi:hypothetical protein
MTCFWDGILNKLTYLDFKFIGYTTRPDINTFIKIIQDKSPKLKNVKWQGEILNDRFILDSINDVKTYDVKNIHGGHLTSSCDVFLLFICAIFKVDIDHFYTGTLIKYRNIKLGRRKIVFNSSQSHFS